MDEEQARLAGPAFTMNVAAYAAAMLALAFPTVTSQAQTAIRSAPAGLPEAHASGVFLNADGDVLTAQHAVAECGTIYVVKDGRIAVAALEASSPKLDLAVLRTKLKPYLSATLPLTMPQTSGSVAVFAEAYNVLQRLPDRASLISNAITVPGEGGMQMLSGVKPGASGSAVLGDAGLLLGVIVERIPSSSNAGVASGAMLSRAASAGVPIGGTLVRAVGVTQIKQFLRDSQISFAESDAAQLGPQQSPAARAATLTVGIICG